MRWQKGRQLEKVTKGNTTYTFTYDAEGRRTSKQWSIGRDIQYLWDGDLLIGEYVVGQETITYSYDASGSPVGFTYTDLTGYYEGGVPCNFLYRKNPQGDIIGIVDWSGNEFVKYNYDAWGNLISYTMHGDNLYSLHYNLAEDNPFRYRGYYFDRETGFYYLNSRYYDPAIGRFINADGYVGTGTGLLGYNMYAYCNNNPVMYVDINGNAAEAFAQPITEFAHILGELGLAGATVGIGGLLAVGFVYFVEFVITGTQPLPHETPVTVEPPPAELVYPEPAVNVQPKVKIETEVAVDVDVRKGKKSTELNPKYYGAIVSNGALLFVTPGMDFQSAQGWVYITAIAHVYGKGRAWGVYTESRACALLLTSSFGIPLHEDGKPGEFSHYHTHNRLFMGMYKHFHVWYGEMN